MKNLGPTFRLSIMLLAATLIIMPLGLLTAEAGSFQLHAPIAIHNNSEFTSANGVSGGNGSLVNPFIIQGFNITASNGVAINITGTTDYFIIENVVISSSRYGIILDKTLDGQVSNSTLSGNQNGLLVLFSNETLVYNNDFLSNAQQANDTGGYNNAWDNGYAAGGNYWKDYTGVDKCSGYAPQRVCPDPDGIGDTPYIIPGDSGSVDDYPLMKPYLPDILPPVWPLNKQLTASMLTAHSLTLKWTNATDDTGVTSYRVFEGKSIIANVTANHSSFNVTGLNPSVSYTFKVEAGDHSDNWSNDGPALTLETPSAPLWSTISDFLVGNWYLLAPFVVGLVSFAVLFRLRSRSVAKGS